VLHAELLCGVYQGHVRRSDEKLKYRLECGRRNDSHSGGEEEEEEEEDGWDRMHSLH
jgi:hypothetical protein